MLIVTVLLGAATSTLAFGDYWTNPGTWSYLLRNALLVGGYYSLPGVLDTAVIAHVVNGSLWTIPQEVRCYLALVGIGALGLLRARTWLTALFVAGVAVHLIVPVDAIAALEQPRLLGIAFLFGVLLYVWRDRLFLSWPFAVTVVAAALVLPESKGSELLLTLGAAYLTIVGAILVPDRLKRLSVALPDYSYGIYIYGFPCQQVVVAAGIGVTPYPNMTVAFGLTLICAAASWHLVEKPALSQKTRLLRSRVSAPV